MTIQLVRPLITEPQEGMLHHVASLIRIAYGVALMIIVLRMPLGIVGLIARRWGRR